MGDSKIRCTTCYNVFNSSKELGEKVMCPMCDNSFTLKKNSFIPSLAQSITDLTTKIGSNIKEKITSENKIDEAVFEVIEGKRYDKELIKVAKELTNNKEEITIEGSKKLFTRIRDYDDYTQIEKQTVAYIRKKYKFTPEANQWLRKEIRKWASTKTRGKNVSDPTSADFKDNNQISFVFNNLKDAYRWDNLKYKEQKTPAQWAGILLSIVFVLGLMSGIAYGIKWNNQETQWSSEGLSAIHGTVIDTNGESIENVIVEANGRKTSTNPQGWYVIYDLVGNDVEIKFTMEGYGDVTVWTNLRSEGTNVLDIELLEGNSQKFDYRKEVAEPWPPNYALAPIFMIASIVALMGGSAALLQQNFRMAVAGCLCGVISYGFLLGTILSIIALSLILADRKNFEN
tara:strand:+ start:180 stop:1379 length:1200 start_codon:yes stop_codon:yes gene_type:complete